MVIPYVVEFFPEFLPPFHSSPTLLGPLLSSFLSLELQAGPRNWLKESKGINNNTLFTQKL